MPRMAKKAIAGVGAKFLHSATWSEHMDGAARGQSVENLVLTRHGDYRGAMSRILRTQQAFNIWQKSYRQSGSVI
jgi:hypothetical protein